MNEQPVILWDCQEDAENLNHATQDEAIESYLDGSNRWEGKITVYGYARMIVPKPDEFTAERLVEDHILTFFEELIGEDGLDITDRMKEAALTFLDVLHEEFVPHACEQVASEEIDVADWIAENRPNWLEGK